MLDVETVVKCLTESPKKRFGIEIATIDTDNKAELTLFTPKGNYIFSEANILSTSKNSIFLGKELKGKAYGIINNNQLVLNS